MRIAQSALQYPGTAHLKASTIAQSLSIITKTVYRAVYKGAYDKAVERPSIPKMQLEPQRQQRPVPFYNWLVVR